MIVVKRYLATLVIMMIFSGHSSAENVEDCVEIRKEPDSDSSWVVKNKCDYGVQVSYCFSGLTYSDPDHWGYTYAETEEDRRDTFESWDCDHAGFAGNLVFGGSEYDEEIRLPLGTKPPTRFLAGVCRWTGSIKEGGYIDNFGYVPVYVSRNEGYRCECRDHEGDLSDECFQKYGH